MATTKTIAILACAVFLIGRTANAAAEVLPDILCRDGAIHWQSLPTDRDGAGITVLPAADMQVKSLLRLTSNTSSPRIGIDSERFALVPDKICQASFQARNNVSRSGAGVLVCFYDAAGKELNNIVTAHDTADQDIAIVSALPSSGWKRYQVTAIPPEGAVTGRLSIRSWAGVTCDFGDFNLDFVEPIIAPPWPPTYKLSPADTAHLTDADVVGPDGLVYPDWRKAGVAGGIPDVKTVVDSHTFDALVGQNIADALENAIASASHAGGGAIELPAGTFYLDRSFMIDQDRVVLRGAGLDKTHLIFRDRIPYGTVRLMNWAGPLVKETGPGGAVEIQANPKGLVALTISCEGKKLAESTIKMHWGNTYSLRIAGEELLKKLGAGTHSVEGGAVYANGDRFNTRFKLKIVESPIDAPAPTMQAAIVVGGGGPRGEKVLLAADARRGDRRVRLSSAAGFAAGDRIRLEAPATPRWNELVGNRCPWGTYRAGMFEVAAVDGHTLVLTQPVRIEFPVVDGSFVQKIHTVSGVGIEALTLEQETITPDPTGPESPLTHGRPIEDLWTNGITFSYAWGCWARNIRINHAGRNPIYFPHSKFCEVRDNEFNNSLFKGGGGTAYIGFETAFDCLMMDVTTHALRHAPDLQWGASGNVIRASHFVGSDAQFHAGWTNENLLEGNTFSATADDAENGGYGFGIFASGPSSPEHGPQGPRNVIYHNDVVSPGTGLMMLGGNENWLVLYNRFRVESGNAIVGKEMSFDHVICGNVFVLQNAALPAVYFKNPNCTGVELINNRFYGNVEKPAGFKGGLGKWAVERGNKVLPLSEPAPLPAPDIESIYLWQKGH